MQLPRILNNLKERFLGFTVHYYISDFENVLTERTKELTLRFSFKYFKKNILNELHFDSGRQRTDKGRGNVIIQIGEKSSASGCYMYRIVSERRRKRDSGARNRIFAVRNVSSV